MMSKQGDSFLKLLRQAVIANFTYFSRVLGLDRAVSRKIKQAGIPMAPEEYGAWIIALAVFTFFLVFPPVLIFSLLSGKSPIVSFLMAFTIAFAVSLLAGFAVFLYPDLVISDKNRNIAANLPFVTIYMATLASSGMTPLAIFKALASFEEFGEVSKEAKKIVREVELLGRDLLTAMENAASRTPNTAFKELLWGMRSTIMSGGNLTAYLVEKARTYSENFRNYLDRYISQLSLITEIYITLIVVGSIFMVIMSIILGFLGETNALSFAKFGVYFGLPIASIMILALILSLNPEV